MIREALVIMDNQFFKNIEKKTGVNMNDVLELANSLQNANFKDEKTVRNVIKRVSQIANKPVSKETENKIVESIVKDGKQLDFNTISKMINKNK
jgi:Stage VI sporulation protein F